MQLFTVTIATISLAQSAVIPSSANDVIVSENIIDETLAAIQSDDKQEPDWLIEFNQYMDNDTFDFDFDAFMSKMSDEDFEDLLKIYLYFTLLTKTYLIPIHIFKLYQLFYSCKS